MNGTDRVFDKTQKDTTYFAKMPTDLAHYMYVPGFRGDLAYLYTLLVDYYSAAEGYAYPTQDQLALKTGKSTQSVRTDIRRLRDAGLVRIITFEGRNNYGYVPLIPLSQAELWRECPEAEANYRKAIAKLDEERRRNREKKKAAEGYR